MGPELKSKIEFGPKGFRPAAANTLLRLRLLQITFRVPAPRTTSLTHPNQTAALTGSGHSLSSAARLLSHWPAPATCSATHERCSSQGKGSLVIWWGLSLARGSSSSACFAPRLDNLGSRNCISASLGPVEAEPLLNSLRSLPHPYYTHLCIRLLFLGFVSCVGVMPWEAVELASHRTCRGHPQTSESRGGCGWPWTRRQRATFVWSQLWSQLLYAAP